MLNTKSLFHKLCYMVMFLLVTSAIFCDAQASAKTKNYEENNMSELKEEFIRLKDNIKEYSALTADNIKDRTSKYMDKFNRKYESLSAEVKEKSSDYYDSAVEAYANAKTATKDKSHKAYEVFVEKMDKLNDSIEKSNKDK